MPEVVLDARGNNAPLIAAGGGLLLFISLFMDWFEGVSAWKIFDVTDVVLALIALIVIAIGGDARHGEHREPACGTRARSSRPRE